MSPVRYRVERASPASDATAAELRALWRRNLPVEGECAAKFDWLYRQAPWPADDVFLLAADGVAGPVGTAGVFVRRMRVGGPVVEAALLGDFAVDVAHRTLQPALTLMRAVRRQATARFGLVYGFPNQLAAGVCQRVGFSELGVMTRYVRVLRHDRFVRRVLDVPFMTTLAARSVDGARVALAMPRAVRALRGRTLQWPTSTDARLDELWTDAAGQYDIVAERSAAFVDWRLLRHPFDPCQLAALTTADGARILAYAAIAVADAVAYVRDLFGHRDEVGRLLDALIPTLWRRGIAHRLAPLTCGDIDAGRRSVGAWLCRPRTHALGHHRRRRRVAGGRPRPHRRPPGVVPHRRGRRHMSNDVDRVNRATMRSAQAVAKYAAEEGLSPAEAALLAAVADEVRGQPILDLGVGAGRTVPALLALSSDYVGVDLEPKMVALCRRRFAEARFETADARDLGLFPDGRFALVLFSCNGLGDEFPTTWDASGILAEVQRVLRCPAACSRSPPTIATALTTRRPMQLPPFVATANPVKLLVRSARFSVELARRIYNRRRHVGSEYRGPHYSIINDRCHSYGTLLYYISLAEQRRQLVHAGFVADAPAYDLAGRPIPRAGDTTDSSIALLARTKKE